MATTCNSPNHSPFTSPPKTVCLLRLSAIGDVCHVLSLVRTLQRAWPHTRFTWIIGRLEAKLLGHLPDIEFITFDKKAGLAAYRAIHQQLRQRHFDLLLHLQLALRASAIAALVPATIKLGFDRARARELQWLFTNRRIHPAHHQHVLDALFGFAEWLGVNEHVLQWNIPVPEAAQAYAHTVIPDTQPTLVISPCSSHPLRNWRAPCYAQVADYAVEQFGMRILICGGRSPLELAMGAAIAQHMKHPCNNLVGKDTLLEFYATLQRATAILTPDSGPAHMATAAGLPVLGLYAATNPARSGPYLSRQWCVDQYDAAAQKFFHKPAALLPWTTKIEYAGVMDLITVTETQAKLHALMANVMHKT